MSCRLSATCLRIANVEGESFTKPAQHLWTSTHVTPSGAMAPVKNLIRSSELFLRFGSFVNGNKSLGREVFYNAEIKGLEGSGFGVGE